MHLCIPKTETITPTKMTNHKVDVMGNMRSTNSIGHADSLGYPSGMGTLPNSPKSTDLLRARNNHKQNL